MAADRAHKGTTIEWVCCIHGRPQPCLCLPALLRCRVQKIVGSMHTCQIALSEVQITISNLVRRPPPLFISSSQLASPFSDLLPVDSFNRIAAPPSFNSQNHLPRVTQRVFYTPHKDPWADSGHGHAVHTNANPFPCGLKGRQHRRRMNTTISEVTFCISLVCNTINHAVKCPSALVPIWLFDSWERLSRRFN